MVHKVSDKRGVEWSSDGCRGSLPNGRLLSSSLPELYHDQRIEGLRQPTIYLYIYSNYGYTICTAEPLLYVPSAIATYHLVATASAVQ